ncbi:hypothetical protein CABS01_16340 [Colletotrichum abscissum]|uniref:uncharacterized protein n=1 Tax=Colletotrichum abscissum TaxID=1671311 RepID=UPI0027D73D1E|nr:uncharacterized protein CABS01_16340 [Colletotrichum abscissum]KAK1471631.1 hypothetical protein CABS01_16340 [Colletotrichum abscissum]
MLTSYHCTCLAQPAHSLRSGCPLMATFLLLRALRHSTWPAFATTMRYTIDFARFREDLFPSAWDGQIKPCRCTTTVACACMACFSVGQERLYLTPTLQQPKQTLAHLPRCTRTYIGQVFFMATQSYATFHAIAIQRMEVSWWWTSNGLTSATAHLSPCSIQAVKTRRESGGCWGI